MKSNPFKNFLIGAFIVLLVILIAKEGFEFGQWLKRQ
jgi:hypothetical protein